MMRCSAVSGSGLDPGQRAIRCDGLIPGGRQTFGLVSGLKYSSRPAPPFQSSPITPPHNTDFAPFRHRLNYHRVSPVAAVSPPSVTRGLGVLPSFSNGLTARNVAGKVHRQSPA
jgi:hypothetical protein